MKLILIVDDEKPIRFSLSNALQMQGYQTFEAAEATEALDFIRKENFDLVITDLHLPGIHGIELLKKIKELRPDLPVVLMSAFGTETSEEKAKDLGAEAFLYKPFSLKSLSQTLEEVFTKPKSYKKKTGTPILIVDDHQGTRESLAEFLGNTGYSVDLAKNGKEALNKVKNNFYQVILMDINMPEMSGITAGKEIKKISPKSFIVMMTGEAEEEEVKKALTEGADYYACLRKPFNFNSLKETLKDIQEESEKHKVLAERSKWEVFIDNLKESFAKFLVLAKRKKLFRLALVIIFSIIFGIYIAPKFLDLSERFSKSFKEGKGFFQRIEGYLQRDEQRELKEK